MLTQLTHTFIHVLDQDEALDFYVGKLGMAVNATRTWARCAGSLSARQDRPTSRSP